MMQERHVAAMIAALLVRKADGSLPSDGQIHVAVNKAWEILRWASGADRRKADRRQRDVPVAIDRRSGLERRMSDMNERQDSLQAEAAEFTDY